MGHEDRECQPDSTVAERGQFVKQLDAREDVVDVDFTRDGFLTVFVEVASDAAVDSGVRRMAERAGYTIEASGTDAHRRWRLAEWWEGSPEAVRVLRTDLDGEATTP